MFASVPISLATPATITLQGTVIVLLQKIFVDYVPCASKHLVFIYSEDRQREYHRTRKDLHHQEK